MSRFIWVSKAVVLALHDMQIAEHGGDPGLLNDSLLDSALDRPRNRVTYGQPDLPELAAVYAYGLARNHPFVDGNKRVSLVVAELFLHRNGFAVDLDDATILFIWDSLARGDLEEDELAALIRAALKPV